jgi:methionine-rich copper-binding protein CopC/putative copper export protein/ABC-type branched-subunit amino acid transport system substrate-binding protein
VARLLGGRLALGGIVTFGAIVALATPAWAHPYLLSSTPSVNAVVPTSPSRIDIAYTEGLDLPYCKVVLVGPNKQQITTHVTRGDASNELVATLDSPLSQAGTYAVEWTAVGDDGHTVIGDYAISLLHTSSNPEVTAGAAPSSGSSSQFGFVWFLRVLLPGATIFFTSMLFLGTVIARMVRSSTRERQDLVGRRFSYLRGSAAALLGGVILALSLQTTVSGGITAFGQSGLGRRLLVEAACMLVATPLLFDGRSLRTGRVPSRVRQWWGYLVASGLLVVLATSSHALTQPSSRRGLALLVYVVHLASVSVWIGALLAVAVPYGSEGSGLIDGVARLRRLVGAAIAAVLVTGVLNTTWALRALGQVVHSSYGSVVIAKFGLFLAVVAVGLVATLLLRRRGDDAGELDVQAGALRARRSGRLLFVELGLATTALLLAGILGELPQPLDFPLASQEFSSSVGLPTSVAESGSYTALGVVTPGLVGANQLVVRIARADINQFLQPVNGVSAVRATVVCGCESSRKVVTLHRSPDGPWWSANVTLPKAATWSFGVQFTMAGLPAGKRDPRATLTAQVEPSALPSQVVVGVAGDFSGSMGEQCQNQVLGLQTALSDVNSQGVDDGDLVRPVAFNVHDGVQPAMDRLLALHPSVLALPCGTPSEVAAITHDASAHHVPVVTSSELSTSPGVWSLGPNWLHEGELIAEQAHTQGASLVSVIAGSSAVDRQELAGFNKEARKLGITERVSGLPTNPAVFVFGLSLSEIDGIVLLANPTEASSVTAALSNLNLQTNWVPPRGILASSQLMNTDYINNAGQITRIGELEIASTINPFDSVDMYYAQRLRALTPGILPTFEGVEGYNAGLTITSALRSGGGNPSTSQLLHLLGTKFKDFVSGSYQASWNTHGGSAAQLAFFRPTYINPLALPANTPAGSQAMTHEGTFLDSGGFEQVAPFREMQ